MIVYIRNICSVLRHMDLMEGKGRAGMVGQDEILRKPENQRFFIWTAGGLKLTGNPPQEVVDAWLTLANLPKRRPWLGFMRKARM